MIKVGLIDNDILIKSKLISNAFKHYNITQFVDLLNISNDTNEIYVYSVRNLVDQFHSMSLLSAECVTSWINENIANGITIHFIAEDYHIVNEINPSLQFTIDTMTAVYIFDIKCKERLLKL